MRWANRLYQMTSIATKPSFLEATECWHLNADYPSRTTLLVITLTFKKLVNPNIHERFFYITAESTEEI